MCGYKLHREALDKLAACYAALGFYDDAAKYAAALIHLSPESPMVCWVLLLSRHS